LVDDARRSALGADPGQFLGRVGFDGQMNAQAPTHGEFDDETGRPAPGGEL
jgi:hypothetical protein